MKTPALVAAALLLSCVTGCVTRVTDFTVISTKNQSATDGYQRAMRVTGSDCVPVIFGPIGTPNLKNAIDNAIEEGGPGYDALVDGVISTHNKSFLFGSYCYEVKGTPINSHARQDHGGNDRARVADGTK